MEAECAWVDSALFETGTEEPVTGAGPPSGAGVSETAEAGVAATQVEFAVGCAGGEALETWRTCGLGEHAGETLMKAEVDGRWPLRRLPRRYLKPR